MPKQPKSASSPTPPIQSFVTCADVCAKIEARLAGAIDDAALAAWAFDRFYAVEVGQATYQLGAASLIADVLDSLMFDDDPGFRLEEAELREFIVQLSTV